MSRDADLLARLPPSARRAWQSARKSAEDRESMLSFVKQAFDEVAFPDTYGSFAELSPVHAALVELLARDPSLGVPLYVTLPYGDSLRRWVGVDPPGVLERAIVGHPSLWQALKTDGDVRALVGGLPIAEQLEVLEHARDYEIDLDDWEPNLDTLRDEGGAWALRYLSAQKSLLRMHVRAPLMPLFLSLVRAKVPIDPRWDGLLPTIRRQPLSAQLRECIDAIPIERRAAAIFAALEPPGPHANCGALVFVLDAYPIADLVGTMFAAFERCGEHPNADERARFEQLAKDHPQLRNVIAECLGAQKKPKPLVFERVAFTSAKLTPLQKKQLQWVEREGLDWSLVELFAVRDAKGKHRYDVTLHAGDDGVVYSAGTTKRVASFTQGGADGRDEKLCAALDEGLATVKPSS